MTRILTRKLLPAFALLLAVSRPAHSQQPGDILGAVKFLTRELITSIQRSDPKPVAAEARIARGKYLVRHVAMCVECHTPRDANGQRIESQEMAGAPIPVTGPKDSAPWAAQSASLAGLGNYDPKAVHYLLTRGQRLDASHPKSPMPSFRFTDEDADAVIAYLKSL